MVTTADGAGAPAMIRAARRLQAWRSTRPDAALLARYAALAVRVDAPLLRRLRLQLLPRAEPGIEADVWFAGLHESQGRNGFVFDSHVQQLLRSELAQQAPSGQRHPLDQAWQITADLHAAWPEALRTEEALTYQALRGGSDSAARIEALLAPVLKAMASGGPARALEVARWAQRAVPRLPDAARQHQSALALWLAALLRLGLPAGQLPDTGAAGLPATLRWLLPDDQVSARQRLALTPFDDALRLQPLADAAPDAPQQIHLPRTRPLLLALQVQDAAGAMLLQRTLALDAAATETRLPLPLDWQTLDLHNLAGERWQLQRQAGAAPVADDPLPWQRMRVHVLNEAGASGHGTFVSPTEVVTVVDVLPPALVQALRAADVTGRQAPSAGFGEPLRGPSGDPLTVRLHAWEADGDRQELQARLVALDLRSALALLVLQRPFSGALVASRALEAPAVDTAAWLGAGLQAQAGRWVGTVQGVQDPARLPAGRPAPDALAQHLGLRLPQTLQDLAGIAGAPVFADRLLVGIADLASANGSNDAGSTLWAVPAPAIGRFLAWARREEHEAPQLLLHHAVDDPYGKGAEIDTRAVQRIEQAAWRARLRLVPGQGSADHPATPATDSIPQDGVFSPGLAGAVRLVTPVTREDTTPEARLRLLGLAARRWAWPDFGVLPLGFRQQQDRSVLPPTLAGMPLQDIEKTDPEALARHLLDLAEPPAPPPAGPLRIATWSLLQARLTALARPFLRARSDLDRVLAAAGNQNLRAVADVVVGRWNSSSRLDAVPLVEVLAQLALPLDDDLLVRVRSAPRGSVALNAMPAQLARLLVARAFAGHAPPPCVVVRDQAWQGTRSIDSIQAQVVDALAQALDSAPGEAAGLLDWLGRLDLAPWVLVTTRPLPDKATLLALETRLPSARLLFLAGPQPDLPATAAAIGAQALPLLPDGADMHWLAGYKRLMEWARPRKRPARALGKPLKK